MFSAPQPQTRENLAECIESPAFEEMRGRMRSHGFTPSDIVLALSKCRNSNTGAIAVQRLLELLTHDWAHEMPVALARVGELNGLDSAFAPLRATVTSNARGITEHVVNVLLLVSLAWPNVPYFTDEPIAGEKMSKKDDDDGDDDGDVDRGRGAASTTTSASLADVLLRAIQKYLPTKSWRELNQVIAITASVAIQGGPVVRERWRALGALKTHLEVLSTHVKTMTETTSHGFIFIPLLCFVMTHFSDLGGNRHRDSASGESDRALHEIKDRAREDEELRDYALKALGTFFSNADDGARSALPTFVRSLCAYAFSNVLAFPRVASFEARTTSPSSLMLLPSRTVESMLENLTQSSGPARYHSAVHHLCFFRNYTYNNPEAVAQLLSAPGGGVEELMRAAREFAHAEEVLKAGLGLFRNLSSRGNWTAQARLVACGLLDLVEFAKHHVVSEPSRLSCAIPLLGCLLNLTQTRLGLACLARIDFFVLDLALESLRTQCAEGEVGTRRSSARRPPPFPRDLLVHHKLALSVILALCSSPPTASWLLGEDGEVEDVFLVEYVRVASRAIERSGGNPHLVWRFRRTLSVFGYHDGADEGE